MAVRIIIAVFLLALLASSAWADDVYILRKPKPEDEEVRSTFENEEWLVGFDLREGFNFKEEALEEDVFNMLIHFEGYPLSAALTVEQLDEDLTSLGYWRKMQKRDPMMEKDLAYEKAVDIAGTSGIQVRIEGSNQKTHYLILSVVFTSGSNGYILSCFTESYFFDKVPDFLAEVADGFYLIDEEVEDDAGDDETDDNGETPSTDEVASDGAQF